MENKILLVVDMQQGFMHKPKYRKLIGKINKLIQDSNYSKIVFTKFISSRMGFYEDRLNWRNLQTEESQEIVIDFPQEYEIFEKYTYGLEEKDLEKIKALNVESVDVCGIEADACVYAIALQLWDHRIFPNILFRYTETYRNKREVKKIFVHQFGKVDEKKDRLKFVNGYKLK